MTTSHIDVVSRLVAPLVTWWEALTRPKETGKALLNPATSTREKTAAALGIWAATWLISSSLLLPIEALTGIRWDSLTFILPLALLACIGLLGIALTLRVGLKLVGVEAKLEELLVLYTIRTAPASVFLVVTEYPTSYKLFSVLRNVKGRGLGFGQTIAALMDGFRPTQSLGLLDVALSLVSFATFLLTTTLLYWFARDVVRLYAVPRARTYLGITLGTYLGVFQGVVLSLLAAFVTYVAIDV